MVRGNDIVSYSIYIYIIRLAAALNIPQTKKKHTVCQNIQYICNSPDICFFFSFFEVAFLESSKREKKKQEKGKTNRRRTDKKL
jgi:hypothetical protein